MPNFLAIGWGPADSVEVEKCDFLLTKSVAVMLSCRYHTASDLKLLQYKRSRILGLQIVLQYPQMFSYANSWWTRPYVAEVIGI